VKSAICDTIGVQITFFKLPVTQHLRPQAAGVQAMLVIEVLLPTADGAMFVFQVLPEDVLRDSSDRPAGFHVYAGLACGRVFRSGGSTHKGGEKRNEPETRQDTSTLMVMIFHERTPSSSVCFPSSFAVAHFLAPEGR
jgi:hypothetical protein